MQPRQPRAPRQNAWTSRTPRAWMNSYTPPPPPPPPPTFSCSYWRLRSMHPASETESTTNHPDEFARKVSETLPVAVSVEHIGYDTVVIRDDARQTVRCLVYYRQDVEMCFEKSAAFKTRELERAHVLYGARLESYELAARTMKGLSKFIMDTLAVDSRNTLRGVGLINVEQIYYEVKAWEEIVEDAHERNEFLPAAPARAAAAMGAWNSAVITPHHELWLVLVARKEIALNPFAYWQPSRAAFFKYAETLPGMDENLRQCIVSQRHSGALLFAP
ncbi:hypothetical protein BDZ89DRAFT_1056742 [Hymenopellis radicata]|nr:hypothetical protein BDZ89DRAFT_1056742 [Hymenopellis radicata]